MRRMFLVSVMIFLGAAHSGALAKDCREPQLGSKAASMFSPPYAAVVTGKGGLQFYSAPNASCAIPGIFILPKQEVIAYGVTNDNGWASVLYTDNPHSSAAMHGWVKFNRLRIGGTVEPKQ